MLLFVVGGGVAAVVAATVNLHTSTQTHKQEQHSLGGK